MPEVQNIADWRGATIVDADGEKVGKLEDVYVDTETDEPQFGSVKEGVIGRHLTFVPLVGATVGRDHIQILHSKKRVKDAPNIDADGELSAAEEADLYRHYEMPYTPATTESGRRLARR